jgi:hypothetical protein
MSGFFLLFPAAIPATLSGIEHAGRRLSPACAVLSTVDSILRTAYCLLPTSFCLLLFGEGRDAGERHPGKELQGGAAAGRNVTDLRRHTRLRNGRH